MQQRRGRQGFAHCDRRSSRWRSASRRRVVATARNVADGPQMSASDVIVVGEVSSVQQGRALIYDMNFDGLRRPRCRGTIPMPWSAPSRSRCR
jgi:hypothetical protein